MASTFTWPDGNADATKVELLTTTYILQIYIHMCKITVIKVVTQRKKELKLGSARETKNRQKA